MQTKKTAPFDVSNSTKQTDSNYQFNQECNYNLFECSCALARPNQQSIWFGLDFSLLLSLFQDKESNENCYIKAILPNQGFMFFLLLVQKKERNLPTGRQGKAHRQ